MVADAGMMSEANCKDLEDAGLRFIVGAKIPDVPYRVKQWLGDHPGEQIPDQQVFTQPTTMGRKDDLRKRTIFYQYRADRARRTLKGIATQIAKAEKAVAAGPAAVKRNRFVQLSGGTRQVNRDLEAKARALAGLKGYVTNLAAPTPEFVLGAYHQLWQIEKSFRMSKSGLRARPIYHKRDSIEAHLTIVMAALAVSRWLEHQTGWSIRKIVQTLRPYRSIAVQTGSHILHAGTPLDDQARAMITAVNTAAGAH